MPILYEPAQPFSPSTAYAYGQQQQSNQDREFALRAAALQQQRDVEQARLLAQAGSQNAILQSRASEDQARINFASQQAGMDHQLREKAFEAQQYASPRDQWAAQHQADLQQQHQRAQVEGQMAIMTQADQLRLQQLRAADAQLEKMYTIDGTLSKEAYEEGKARLAGVQGPMEIKAQQYKIQQMKEQTEQTMHQNAIMRMMEAHDQKIAAGNFNELPTMDDGMGNKVRMALGRDGKWYDPFGEARNANLKMREMAMQKAADVAAKAEKDKEAAMTKAHDRWVEQQKDITDQDRHAVATWAKQNPEAKPEDIASKESAIRSQLMGEREIGATFEEHYAKKTSIEERVDAMFTGTAKPRNQADQFAYEVGRRARALPEDDRKEVKDIVETAYTGRMKFLSDADLKDYMGSVLRHKAVFPQNFLLEILQIAEFRSGAKKPQAAPARGMSPVIGMNK